jgi:hypothetical protein
VARKNEEWNVHVRITRTCTYNNNKTTARQIKEELDDAMPEGAAPPSTTNHTHDQG